MLKYYVLVGLLSIILAWYFEIANVAFQSLHNRKFEDEKIKLFTKYELQEFNGLTRSELYLVVMGEVFDVSKGDKHYGPGMQYHTFVGRDNSRSFITGEFADDQMSDEVIGLSHTELLSVVNWRDFYAKTYTTKGKLIGRYYDSSGNPTPYGKEALALIKTAKRAKETDDSQKQRYPPCNIEWDAERGTRVWCTSKSGGVLRDWVGYPRKFYDTSTASADTKDRCACIPQELLDMTYVRQYDNCEKYSETCFFKDDST